MKQLTAKHFLELNQKQHLILEPKNVKLPEFKNETRRWRLQGPVTLPENMIVTKFERYTSNYVGISYVTPDRPYKEYVIVPNDFILKHASKTKAARLIKKYEKWQIDNLRHAAMPVNFEIGSDPEIFAETETGVIVPAFDFLGSKQDPTRFENSKDHPEFGQYWQNNIYWDGFQAEFETKAMHCAAWHIDSIYNGLLGLYQALKKHNPNAKLSSKTVMDIPPSMLHTAKPEHVAFGCSPSYNVYGMKGLSVPGHMVNYRASGGHIHFGCGELKPEVLSRIVKGLDTVLGVACVSLFANYDDPRRRQMYGLAGEYRTPKHGLEYRTLSNAWLFHPLLTNLVFDLSRAVFSVAEQDLIKFWNASEEETIKCINTCDVDLAREILKRNKKFFKKILGIYYQSTSKQDAAFRWFIEGADSIIQNMNDIETNWCLKNHWETHCNNLGKSIDSVVNEFETGEKV